ncbi:hypothetical protein SeLEV6574_g07738, partial [Synchytrium endobioticum]
APAQTMANDLPPRYASDDKVHVLTSASPAPEVAISHHGPISAKVQPVAVKELLRYATATDVFLMLLGLLVAAIAGAAQPGMTILFGGMVDSFTKFMMRCVEQGGQTPAAYCFHYNPSELEAEVSALALQLVYIAIAVFVATYIYMAIWVYTGEKITHTIREQYIKAIMRQDIAFFDSVGAGEVTSRVSSDTLLVQDGISEKVPLIFNMLGTFFAAFIIAFTKSWILTVALCAIIPIMALVGFVMNFLNTRLQTEILDKYSEAATLAEESLTGVRIIHSLNAQDKTCLRFKNRLHGARLAGIKKSVVMGAGIAIAMCSIYLMYSLAFYFGARLLYSGQLSSGNIITVIFSVLIGSVSLAQMAPDVQAITLARSAGAKLFHTIDRVPSIDPYNQSGSNLTDVKGRIEFKNIKFIYPARPDLTVLTNYSLLVEPGTTVALVGASGSGKSTIIQMIERFYDPVSGTVSLDGVDIKTINVKSLRQAIGYVQQEPVLFEGSVYQNIVHGLVGSKWEDVPMEHKRELVQQAAAKANAHDFIMKLPLGYDNPVGERGCLLSGGQKQRVCIARAIVKDPRILLLDEATSALDTNSERVVQAALDKVSEGRTTVVIAHRLSTIRNAHKIVVMTRGEIVEMGTHNALLQIENGVYKKLVAAQHLAQEEAAKKAQNGETDDAVADADPDQIIIPTVQDLTRSKSLHGSIPASLHGSSKKDVETGNDKDDNDEWSGFRVIYEVFKLNRPEAPYIALGLFGASLAGCVPPAIALMFANVLGVFTETGDKLLTDANFWSCMFLMLAFVAAFSNLLSQTSFGISSEKLTERVRAVVFQAILRQDVAFFDDDNNATGVLTSNLSVDAEAIRGASGAVFGSMTSAFSTLFAGTVIGLINSWKLALVALTTLPLLILAGTLRYTILTYFKMKAQKAYEKSSQLACEAVAAIRTVQSLTRENDVHAIYFKMLEEPLRDGFKNAYLNTLLFAASQATNFMSNALVFWYGGRLIAYEGLSLTNFFTTMMAIVMGASSVGHVFANTPDLNRAMRSAKSVFALLNRQPLIDSFATTGDKPTVIEGKVEFKNVQFVYPTRPKVKVLKGLNMTVEPGQFVALVGASGCGKSTTIGLVERFYDVQAGQVMIDDRNIKDYNLQSYRRFIGLVSQEPMLFDMTIKENIIYGLDFVPSEEEIIESAKMANIHEFISTLPARYDTKVGSKGSQLSGGQKQRIAIARALVRKPKILLLDEATSALDAESEKIVQAALDNASRGRTTLSIAHRLSTIQHADVIYVFKDGVVAEQGTHQELLRQRGLYSELAMHQNLAAH